MELIEIKQHSLVPKPSDGELANAWEIFFFRGMMSAEGFNKLQDAKYPSIPIHSSGYYAST